MVDFHVIIPARYGSTRLPGKVLRRLAGAPLIEHVHRVALASGATAAWVATDDPRVRSACEAFGAQVMPTASTHTTGTDRIAECVARLELAPETIVVNLQGDEPLTPPAALAAVAAGLERHRAASIATLCTPITSAAELHNPNAVKVVLDREGYALYFSRAPIPYDRDTFARDSAALPETRYYRHLGLYAYRAGYLRSLSALPPSPAERAEKLEQLRALQDGARIHVGIVPDPIPAGVDSEDDLERVARRLKEQASGRGLR